MLGALASRRYMEVRRGRRKAKGGGSGSAKKLSEQSNIDWSAVAEWQMTLSLNQKQNQTALKQVTVDQQSFRLLHMFPWTSKILSDSCL